MAPLAAAARELERPPARVSLEALARQLDELVNQLMVMDPTTYTSRPAPGVSGSIGEHVRHVLDHVAALTAADCSAPLSYDHRERGTSVETDVSAALRQVLRLKAALGTSTRWSARTLDQPILVESIVSTGGDAAATWSTIGREVTFVLSHTIHHLSTIALLMDLQGLGVPDRFGYSPSTPVAR